MEPKLIFCGCALVLATGCSMAPKYTRPEAPVRKAWTAEAPSTGVQASSLPWQDFITDPNQRAVIALALEQNRDLRIAALSVEKAQAYYRIQRSELLPGVGVLANGNRYRMPEKVASDGKAVVKEQYSVNVGLLSWEVDLFGRLQSLKTRALNQYLATEQAHVAARVSLVAAVAQGYLVLAADRENLQLAQGTFESQKAFYELIAKSREIGVASELELRQAQSQMEAARGEAARFRGLVAQDQNALELLVGTQVPEHLLPKALGAVQEPMELAPGLPSEVLLRRPDILQAEFQLKAAYANIGAARAAFFPRLSLTAGAGTMSPAFSSLFESGTRTWSFTPQIVAPIFAGGSLLSNLKVSQLDRDIAVAQYEKAIQTAFREVGDGLVRRTALTEQLDATRALVEALDTSQRLSTARYQEGLDGYLGVLVAQRAFFGAQQGLVAVRLAYRTNQITLYKALGGHL